MVRTVSFFSDASERLPVHEKTTETAEQALEMRCRTRVQCVAIRDFPVIFRAQRTAALAYRAYGGAPRGAARGKCEFYALRADIRAFHVGNGRAGPDSPHQTA